jgi:hypothetical protein
VSAYCEVAFDDVYRLVVEDDGRLVRSALERVAGRLEDVASPRVAIHPAGPPSSDRVAKLRFDWTTEIDGAWANGRADVSVIAVRTGARPITELALRAWAGAEGAVDPANRPVLFLRDVLDELADLVEEHAHHSFA